jgi:hypothetical protein
LVISPIVVNVKASKPAELYVAGSAALILISVPAVVKLAMIFPFVTVNILL